MNLFKSGTRPGRAGLPCFRGRKFSRACLPCPAMGRPPRISSRVRDLKNEGEIHENEGETHENQGEAHEAEQDDRTHW